MRVGLVTDVPNETIVRRVEGVVQCNGQFDCAEADVMSAYDVITEIAPGL